MKKKIYSKPVLCSEEFIPNAYAQVCSHTESGAGNYLFECDAPAGELYYYNKYGRVDYVGSYTPCSKKHEAPTNGEFPLGFIDYNDNGKEDPGEQVRLYLEYKNGLFGSYISNGHATTKINQETWQKNIS